jgi:hypothetical protein
MSLVANGRLTALDYALETIKKYEEISIKNPRNNSWNTPAAEAEWVKTLEAMTIQIKLDTILERLPYIVENRMTEYD